MQSTWSIPRSNKSVLISSKNLTIALSVGECSILRPVVKTNWLSDPRQRQLFNYSNSKKVSICFRFSVRRAQLAWMHK